MQIGWFIPVRCPGFKYKRRLPKNSKQRSGSKTRSGKEAEVNSNWNVIVFTGWNEMVFRERSSTAAIIHCNASVSRQMLEALHELIHKWISFRPPWWSACGIPSTDSIDLISSTRPSRCSPSTTRSRSFRMATTDLLSLYLGIFRCSGQKTNADLPRVASTSNRKNSICKDCLDKSTKNKLKISSISVPFWYTSVPLVSEMMMALVLIADLIWIFSNRADRA